VSELRLLLPGNASLGDLTRGRAEAVQALADLYAYPQPLPAHGWVRATVVSTLDGAAAGPDGRSASVSAPVDRVALTVFRGLADVVLVGAGTARTEGYGAPAVRPEFAERRATCGQPAAPVLVVVSRSGDLATGHDLDRDPRVLVMTCSAGDVSGLRRRLGPDRVIVAGEESVEPDLATAQLAARGLRRILLEGGPALLGAFVATGRLDELCLTLTPRLVGSNAPRVAHGLPAELPVRTTHLLECDGVLLGRWLVQR